MLNKSLENGKELHQDDTPFFFFFLTLQERWQASRFNITGATTEVAKGGESQTCSVGNNRTQISHPKLKSVLPIGFQQRLYP